ncbi:MAG: DUF2934 domain-containing protein [Planctomycetes bacterium]|nr:DUF2934 domain-containing protein [Planctomycetota bacterium]
MSSVKRPPTEEEIRQLAYSKWEDAGSPTGDGVSFWLEAENELLAGHLGDGVATAT